MGLITNQNCLPLALRYKRVILYKKCALLLKCTALYTVHCIFLLPYLSNDAQSSYNEAYQIK